MTTDLQNTPHKIQQGEIPHFANQRKKQKLYFALVALLLIVFTFLLARTAGIKDGQKDARAKIEATINTTDGPTSLK